MVFLQALADHKFVILFYSIIMLAVYLNRKKFDIQGKIIAMYRTKVGVDKMDRWGKRFSEPLKLLGTIGIGVGYIGMFAMSYILLKNLIQLFMKPDSASAVSLVIPGVAIPGSPIMIPLISGWIALFVVILVHEFSHGLVARAHGLKVRSSGIFFLGPIMGAFVEPDEKQLQKADPHVQYAVFAAGPWSNIILGALVFVVLSYMLAPVVNAMNDEVGVPLAGAPEGFPAFEAGLKQGHVITEVNGVSVVNFEEFAGTLTCLDPGEEISIVANETTFTFPVGEHPDDKTKGYLGVLAAGRAEQRLKRDSMFMQVTLTVLLFIAKLLNIIGILSVGIGLANLLPLGPVDGGRMLQLASMNVLGKNRGLLFWKRVSLATLFVLVLNIFWPLFRGLGGLFL